ncbi:hypothetical protein [Rathayibacter sp. PhB127]|uniref:hypothetical protein n=1 Tax=Rathayibacter sp. PhB127 TaxID=2485176 RepID=UPI0011CDE78B|nr:hypothetical protein [Rathayibacter sp. PhB127]
MSLKTLVYFVRASTRSTMVSTVCPASIDPATERTSAHDGGFDDLQPHGGEEPDGRDPPHDSSYIPSLKVWLGAPKTSLLSRLARAPVRVRVKNAIRVVEDGSAEIDNGATAIRADY